MNSTKFGKSGKQLKGWKHKPAKKLKQVDPDASLVKVPKLKTKAPPPPIPGTLLARTLPAQDEVIDAEKKALAARPKVNHPIPPAMDNTVTHLEFTTADGRTTVVCPVNCFGDFSSLRGTIKYGRLRYGDDFIPRPEDLPQDADLLPGTTAAVNTATPKPPRAKTVGGAREGVCDFIDKLIMAGGKTAQQICDLTVTAFPGRDPAATLSTVKTRPSRLKGKGITAPAFVK